MKKYFWQLTILSLFILPDTVNAQSVRDTLGTLTLQQCIDFALRNQPGIRQANIDENINERDIRISLSSWLPQINSSGSFQHYLERATIVSGTNANTGSTGTGTGNTGTGTGTGGTGTGTGGTGVGTGGGATTGGAGATGGGALALANNVSSLGLQASQVILTMRCCRHPKLLSFPDVIIRKIPRV